MKHLLLCCYMMISLLLCGQDTEPTLLPIVPIYQGEIWEAVQFEETQEPPSPTQIEKCQFYLSEIRLIQEGKIVYTESGAHLIDFAQADRRGISLHAPQDLAFDEIEFLLGVDSTVQAGGAMGGDLDPTQGMYWSWQSGYIHFKLEGRNPDCGGRNQQYIYHVGGYRGEYNSLIWVKLPIDHTTGALLYLDLDQLLAEQDLSTGYHMMSPGKAALEMAQQIREAFRSTR